ncbi:taste receptor type 2 member 9-like [Trachemys scripta elegans]|uniref:taste receptor type 2 member 9-like n=1 Tax=Trachemys scripta elegans TaxID=31138 RepID=UPI00155387DC|nr:taste receptor type 2 member 9-like [Trachemys scripta elegans]
MIVRRKMFISFYIIGLIVLLMEIIIGMFGNGFIALIYCIDWVKSRKLFSCDMILTCLAMSRILLQGIFTADLFIHIFAPGTFHLNQVQISLSFLWFFANTVGLWFTACLGIFYCVKITICNQPLFLRMKQTIFVMVPKLLLWSLLVSFVTSIPLIWGAASFIPFIIFLTTSILLISSLWRHTRNMQCNATSFWDPSTEAYVSAIKVLISCHILYIFYFVAVTVLSLPTCLTDRTWTPAITSMVLAAYTPGHSLILILINPKLKQALVRILQIIKCHLKRDFLNPIT